MIFNINAALLDALVLAIVKKEDTYGYEITRVLKNELDVSESTLYPVLRRLQKDDCLEIYDKEYSGRNRRYYKITDRGRKQLDMYRDEWQNYKATEFLAALRRELGFLPKDELDDAIRYYDEYINDAGDDEEKVIAEMGTPHKVAEEFKNEYYDIKNVNDESAKHNNQISWKTVLVCILAVGFGVPVLNMIRNALPGITGIVILVVVIVLLIKFLGNKTNQRIAVSNATVQTCSDIENIYLDLKAGNFEFRTGDSFAVDTMSAGEVKVKSYIANNTWTVEGSKTIGNNENGVVSIIIPKGFHAKKAVMKLTAGNILVSGLSADNTKVEVGMGKCEIKNMYSQHLNMKCGMGDIVGSCSMNGDVNVDCGMGNVTLTLTNSADNFNMSATAGMGCVDIGGAKIHGAGSKLDNNIGALHNINVKCGMGNVKIGFNERDEA